MWENFEWKVTGNDPWINGLRYELARERVNINRLWAYQHLDTIYKPQADPAWVERIHKSSVNYVVEKEFWKINGCSRWEAWDDAEPDESWPPKNYRDKPGYKPGDENWSGTDFSRRWTEANEEFLATRLKETTEAEAAAAAAEKFEKEELAKQG